MVRARDYSAICLEGSAGICYKNHVSSIFSFLGFVPSHCEHVQAYAETQ